MTTFVPCVPQSTPRYRSSELMRAGPHRRTCGGATSSAKDADTQNEIIGNPLTPLMLACLNCHPNCVKVWLEYVKTSGLDLFVQGQSELRNETALSMAVRKALGCTFELFDGKTVTDDDAERARECATAILKKDMYERPEEFTTRYAGCATHALGGGEGAQHGHASMRRVRPVEALGYAPHLTVSRTLALNG